MTVDCAFGPSGPAGILCPAAGIYRVLSSDWYHYPRYSPFTATTSRKKNAFALGVCAVHTSAAIRCRGPTWYSSGFHADIRVGYGIGDWGLGIL
jgi:hypothetical protein